MEGWGLRGWGDGSGVEGLGLRVQGRPQRGGIGANRLAVSPPHPPAASLAHSRPPGEGFQVEGIVFRVQGLRFRVSGFGCRL